MPVLLGRLAVEDEVLAALLAGARCGVRVAELVVVLVAETGVADVRVVVTVVVLAGG
jgi:hypothetical protein